MSYRLTDRFPNNIYADNDVSQQLEGDSEGVQFKAKVFTGSISRFLELFVPSLGPPLTDAPLRTPFLRFNPRPGEEVRNYGGLVRLQTRPCHTFS